MSGLHHESFPPFFETDPSSTSVRWSTWLERLENFFIIHRIKKGDEKRAALLHYAGEWVYDIFKSLPNRGDADDYESAKACLNTYFQQTKNTDYEIFQFREATQRPDETINQFYARLRKLASTCEFQHPDPEIKSQIINRCHNQQLRIKAFETKNLTLDKLLELGKSLETIQKQAREIQDQINLQSMSNVNRIQPQQSQSSKPNNSRNYFSSNKPVARSATNQQSLSSSKCYFCGQSYPHAGGRTNFPAYGKTCRNCGKLNHFSQQCLSRRQSQSSNISSPSVQAITVQQPQCEQKGSTNTNCHYQDENIYTCHVKTAKNPSVVVKVNEQNIPFLIDTGASINIIDEPSYAKLNSNLCSSDVKIFPYGSNEPLHTLGVMFADVSYNNCVLKCVKIFVAKGAFGCLLSYDTAVNLNLIGTLNFAEVQCTNDMLCNRYAKCFEGIGKLKGYKAKLHIDDSVTPIAVPHRRIPFHVRTKVNNELQYLLDNDIIEKVDGPTPWVSPIVTPPKPNNPDEIRICVDMRNANKAICRERHTCPTIDDLIHRLNGATVFSKRDLNKGYHQIELDDASRYITTFSSHQGLFRYKRLNFGVCSAAELFQKVIQQTLDGIPGTCNISDDIIIFGKNKAEHDCNLHHALQRLSEKGLTWNKQKCEFTTSKLDFYGFTFSASGISAQHKKLEDIKNLQRPSSATEVRSLLGLANYCSRLIKDFSTITHPLCELTRKGAKFEWTPECEKALLDLKRSLTSDETLGYFDPNNHTELIVDASPVGLGAILTQSDITSGSSKIIAYASRALSDVEKRYSQMEREALAIVWGCEHFHLYLFGMQHTFTLVTDHKPLQLILNNPSSKPPARIERWSLRLQPYNFSVVYRSGITNPADYMSRHPANPSCACDDVEEYINLITHSAIPNALSLAEVAEATKNDPTLQKVIVVVRSNNWKSLAKDDDCDVKKYLQLKNELTVSNDDIILKNNKIVLPNSLRKQAIDLAHVGHQGIVKTKQLIREKVWFPGIDKFVESLVKDCIYCQAAVLSPAAEPLNMTPLPDAVWSHLSVDFSGPYSPNNDYLLVIVDEYSRFPVVETVHSTKSSCVIPVLEKVFSLFSIPDVVKSDNGPPFNGSEFAKFAKRLGFKHRKIMPLWPQSNSVAERFMRTLNKAVRISNAEQCSWKCDLHEFLRNYRATPHCSTNTSPLSRCLTEK